MNIRRSHHVVTAVFTLAALAFGTSCGEAGGTVADPSDSTRVPFPEPAEVLDATVVYFDADGEDGPYDATPLGAIVDDDGLQTFARRHVDGDPPLGTAAAQALAAGEVLIGGPVSSGCFTSESGQVVLVDNDVRLAPIGLDEDPNVECVRAVTSIVLMAIEPAELPEGATIQGVEP